MDNLSDASTRPPEDWRFLLPKIAWRRKKSILLMAVPIFLGALAITQYLPPVYEADATLLMRDTVRTESPGSLERAAGETKAISREDLSSELEILGSAEIIHRTIKSLNPDIDDKPIPEPGLGEAPELSADMEAAIREIKPNLEAALLPGSKVIRLTLKGKDPEEAEEFLNTFLGEYLTYRTLLFNPPSQERFISEQAKQFKAKIELLEKESLTRAEETGVADPTLEIESNVLLKRDLRLQRQMLLREQGSSVRLTNAAVKSAMAGYDKAIEELDKRNLELHSYLILDRRAKRDLDILEQSFVTFSKRNEETRINNAIAVSNLSTSITILNPATSSASLLYPKLKLTLALGLFAGLACGCGLAFINEYFDHTFRDERSLERVTGLPVICSIKKVR